MVLVKVYVAVPPAARESTAGVPGRRLLRPGPARPPNQAYHHRHRHQHKGEGKEERGRQKEAGGLEEEGEEEEEKHPQRMLGHHPDITLAMIDHANIPECPAVFHHSSSADDPLRSTALVGAAEVWAKLQLATSRKHCRTKGPCCHVSTHHSVCVLACKGHFICVPVRFLPTPPPPSLDVSTIRIKQVETGALTQLLLASRLFVRQAKTLIAVC